MVLYTFSDGSTIYVDGYLLKKLENIKMIVKKNWDAVFIIVGDEGSGKSTLSFICGQILTDNNLKLSNIAEGSADALKKLQELPDGSLLICDEAELLFSSRETMSKEQKKLTNVMKVIRQKNMVLILVTPVFFDLAKYIAVDRARFLIRCYTNHNLDRGYFAYWGKKKKLKLYINGKAKYGSYARPKADFFGRFVDYIPPFNDEYQILKQNSLDEAFKGKDEDKKGVEKMEKLVKNLEIAFPNEIIQKKSAILGITERTYQNYKERIREKAKFE